jgi:hypothetical protein
MYRNLYDHNFFVAGSTVPDLQKLAPASAQQ